MVLALIASYFMRFGKSDRLVFRILVGFLSVAVIADTANSCSWAYTYTIAGMLNPARLLQLPKEFMAFSFIAGLTVFVVQIFFIWRIWIISGRKNWIFPAIVLLIAAAAFAVALYVIHAALQRPLFTQFGEGATVYYLLIKPRRIGASTGALVNSPLTRLLLVTARTNSLSLLVQTFTLFLVVWKITTFYYAIPGFLEVEVYVASLVITLNARSGTGNGETTDFSDSGPTSRTSKAAKNFGNFSVASRNASGVPSVHVHVQEERHVDIASDFGHAGNAAAKPYAVKFSSASSDDCVWAGGEKGDVELGGLVGEKARV
ncbi:hypothetical protein Rhopal_001623-T1 [Rhodotorula paludigena]|uniref:DUF6534 domain-containing protein n=1 Tax=Rhodotorula paludigena TaxID=86838 RepID=A0AAV5GHV4_9BASI|nr:hypothetical protein Rhopal_001623-T1 [Rhodotorula paludigena]